MITECTVNILLVQVWKYGTHKNETGPVVVKSTKSENTKQEINRLILPSSQNTKHVHVCHGYPLQLQI